MTTPQNGGLWQSESDDLFASSRMSFGDHIEVLRVHMIRAIFGFVLALGLSLFIGKPVLEYIAAPVQAELMRFYTRRIERADKDLQEHKESLDLANRPRPIRLEVERKSLRAALGLKAEEVPEGEEWVDLPVHIRPVELAIQTGEANRLVDRPPTLATLTITEAFMIYFKVCMVVALVLGSPWIFYQLWAFVAAGLYPAEKRLVNVYLPISLGLFLAGVFLCEFLVIPNAVAYLLSFNEWMGFEPDLRLSEWLNFALLMPLVFGLAFQTPLVMLALHRLGIVTEEMFRTHRRIAMFGMACVAILLTASPDAFSMLALMFPLWGLYELGIVLCHFSPRPTFEDDMADSEEMVEV